MIITMGGDVSVTDTYAPLFANRETEKLFGNTTKVLKSSDRVIVNLECAVTDKDTPIKKFGPNLRGPFGTVETLKEAGVTDCGLSNNHIFDFGKPGLYDTISQLEKNGINYTGIGENDIDARKDLIITDGKIKIALITVCEHEYSYALPDRVGAREYDPYDTNEDIAKAKKNADFVVVMYHGGKEYCRYPSPRLLKLCRSMVKNGADVVLCQHSHCIGCYEEYMGAHILYGQGNFHFLEVGNDHSEMWNTGLLARFDFSDKVTVEFIPTVSEDCGIRLADDTEKARLLSELKERSASLQDGSWEKGWHDFCVENTETYSQHLAEGKQDLFGHFLDCEAHTDVWRELFKTWNHTNEK